MSDESPEASCPNVSGCALHPLFVAESLLTVWKERYCDGAYEKCKRFQLMSDGARVEPSLLPNGRHLPVLK